MKICITLDDVIRAKTAQVGKMYKKYINPDIDLESLDFSSGNFKEIFGFSSKKDYEEFLYNQYSYEIFAEASVTEKSVDKKLNLWLLSLEDDEENSEIFDIMLGNPMEFNNSIGYSYFFLAKIATRIREVYFPKDSVKLWDKCDVMITADSNLLKNKPEGKVTIKINTDYNKDFDSDYEYNSLSEFLDDNEILNKLKK